MRLIKENVERIVASKVIATDMLQHGWKEVKEDAAEEEVKEVKRRKSKTED